MQINKLQNNKAEIYRNFQQVRDLKKYEPSTLDTHYVATNKNDVVYIGCYTGCKSFIERVKLINIKEAIKP